MVRILELAAKPEIFNLTLTDANTEYSQVLPVGVRKFTFQSRDINADIKVSFTSGESGTKFLTILGNSSFGENFIEAPIGSALTIYAQTESTGGPILEIITWTIDPT